MKESLIVRNSFRIKQLILQFKNAKILIFSWQTKHSICNNMFYWLMQISLQNWSILKSGADHTNSKKLCSIGTNLCTFKTKKFSFSKIWFRFLWYSWWHDLQIRVSAALGAGGLAGDLNRNYPAEDLFAFIILQHPFNLQFNLQERRKNKNNVIMPPKATIFPTIVNSNYVIQHGNRPFNSTCPCQDAP